MTNVDDILEQCLTELLTGASTVEECLARYPEHTAQLEPLLRTAARVEMGSRVHPSPVFKARARSKLTMHMQAYPRRREASGFPFWRMMAGLAAVVLTLFVTGTVYAQGVLPGDPFYEWKLTSERAWRVVSSNTVITDLRIANRRINEMNVTVKDHDKWARALKGYSEVRSRLEFEIDAETLDGILPPTEVFSYPNIPTLIPEPVMEPSKPKETVVPATKDKDKDQKDKEQQDKDNNGKDKNEPEDTVPMPTAREPKIIPTIEIPPPIH